jgi:phage N-6-adenine-methyltransferase
VNEYQQDMMAGVTFPPVIVFYDGEDYWLADGFHRLYAACNLNRDSLSVDIRQGTRRDAVIHSVGANAAHGKRRTNEDKRRAVLQLLNDEEWSGWSDREIARRCAVSNRFVSNLRPVTVNGSQLEPERTYVTKHGTMAVMNTIAIGGKRAVIEQMTNGSSRKSMRIIHNSGNDVWYTPPEYVEAARALMGDIDTDPASSEIANRIVKAKTFYTEEDDGLAYDWNGRIWMNPPYSQPLIVKFCEKLVLHYQQGLITEACVLVNNGTETRWFNSLLDEAAAICFVQGRIRFLDENGECPPGSPLQGQVIIYFGKRTEMFTKHFSGFGHVFFAHS